MLDRPEKGCLPTLSFMTPLQERRRSGETSFYVCSACIYCTAGLITVGSLSFYCKLLKKNYFQKKKIKCSYYNLICWDFVLL